jgi:hypothetical protein
MEAGIKAFQSFLATDFRRDHEQGFSHLSQCGLSEKHFTQAGSREFAQQALFP